MSAGARYYPPFLGAIKAEVGSIMCSYNRINGNYSCGNNETLATDYKARAGFEGWVMSDWVRAIYVRLHFLTIGGVSNVRPGCMVAAGCDSLHVHQRRS